MSWMYQEMGWWFESCRPDWVDVMCRFVYLIIWISTLASWFKIHLFRLHLDPTEQDSPKTKFASALQSQHLKLIFEKQQLRSSDDAWQLFLYFVFTPSAASLVTNILIVSHFWQKHLPSVNVNELYFSPGEINKVEVICPLIGCYGNMHRVYRYRSDMSQQPLTDDTLEFPSAVCPTTQTVGLLIKAKCWIWTETTEVGFSSAPTFTHWWGDMMSCICPGL